MQLMSTLDAAVGHRERNTANEWGWGVGGQVESKRKSLKKRYAVQCKTGKMRDKLL